MVSKADLHRLIDELPEPALPAAAHLLTALEAREASPTSPADALLGEAEKLAGDANDPDAAELARIVETLTGYGRRRTSAAGRRVHPVKRSGSPVVARKVRRRRFTTDTLSSEPMTVGEVGERHTNRWILMEVHERGERGAAKGGIVLAIGRRRADIQAALFKAFREPNMQSQGYYTFLAQRPIPPGSEGLAIIERNQLRSAMRGSRRR